MSDDRAVLDVEEVERYREDFDRAGVSFTGHLLIASHEALRTARDTYAAEAVKQAGNVVALAQVLRDAKREHFYCEDCWYSCPKAVDGCCDDSAGNECRCGADAWNARIDAVLGESE